MASRRHAARPTPAAGEGAIDPAVPLRRWVVAIAGVASIAVVMGLVVPAAFRPAGSNVEASGEAGSLLTLVNQSRARAGLAPLDYASDLSAVAAERASIMARSGSLTHTPDLGGRVCCWTWIAENVAYAGDVQSLHDVMMGSAPHRANILYANADDVGIAVVKGNGSLWAAEVFRDRSDQSRSSSAGSTSRSGDRTAPTTTSSTGSSTSTSPTPTLTPEQLQAQQLRSGMAHARDRLRADRRKPGPFDPLRAAVRYQSTLDVVSRP